MNKIGKVIKNKRLDKNITLRTLSDSTNISISTLSNIENDKIKNLVKSLSNTTCSVMLIPDTLTLNILHSRTE